MNCGVQRRMNIRLASIRATKAGEISACTVLVLALFLNLAMAQNGPIVPDNIKPPDGQRLVLKGHASGDQIYTCQSSANSVSQFAWALSGPDATLTDDSGKEIATHFAGPTWQAADGSQVKGKVVGQTAPDPDSIAWLLLVATDHTGDGMMSDVRNIQRVNTKGGKAPAAGCDAQHQGDKTRVHYTADYYFYAPAK
jgi:hypothetical protein